MLRLSSCPVRRLLGAAAPVWLSIVLAVPAVVWSQTPKNPPDGHKPVEAEFASEAPSSLEAKADRSTSSNGIKPGVEDLIQLLGRDGQVILIPQGATWDEFQKFLKLREAASRPTAPPFSVSSVTFEGSAEPNEDTVTLDATLTIAINRDDDVLVPLRLNDATLLKKAEHVGPNEHEFDEFDRDAGYRCWLRGKGEHELKMTLAVPVRRIGASRRLTLLLPDTPGSSIKLTVPLPKVAAKGPERGFVRTKGLPNGRTEIQAFGPPGSLLDLTWQAVTDVSEVKPELQAATLISAELRSESLVLEATQQVRSIQGSFEKILVRLPPEFEFLEVSGREVKESSVVAGSPPRVAVTLTAPTTGPIELKWVLAAKVSADATRLPTIEGFEVEDARQQKGHIALTAWEGVNLRKRAGEDRFVEQESPTALRDVPGFHPPANGNGNITVYRFLKQPFRLVFDVQKIEPYFSAEQTHVLRLSAGRADLETTLAVRVFRGSLLELTLPWPGFKSEGWEALSNDTPEVVEQVTLQDTANGPQWLVRLVDRKTRGDREFEIRLRTRRPMPVDGSAFDLSLPFVASSGQRASRVIVAPSSNLEVEWFPKNESVSRPTTPDEALVESLDSIRNVTAWRWETGSPEFTAKAKVQQQSIRSESWSELAFDARSVMVTQRITYDVAFEPLAQVRLMVPRSIVDRVRFQWRDANGQRRPLPPPVFTALEIDQARQCRLSLDPPQVGKFEILADFELDRASDVNGDEPVVVQVPVLQSSDAEFATTRVQWKTGERLTAALEDATWKSELGDEKTSVWRASGAKTAIVIKVSSSGPSEQQDFIVHRALIRTIVSEGRRHSQALFELDRDVREITLTLPRGVSSQQFRAWWNQSPVTVDVLSRTSGPDGVEVRLRLPRTRERAAARESTDQSKRTLWLDYYSEELTHFGWTNQHTLVAPHFASSVWVAQTIWQVVLPADQHLLTAPRDYAPQFHWQRALLLWSRQANPGYDRIDRVLREAAPVKQEVASWELLPTDDGTVNVYPLSCFGPPQPLIFWSMSRSAVVGCGAGLALVLGFVLIRIPATRHVLTFLIVGFVMALAALWFSEPVKVLLQPAILGAAMAVVAAVIDRMGRRGTVAPIVSLTSPSDFYSSGSGVRGVGMAVTLDSNPTPQAAVPKESIPSSASGERS